MYVQALTAVWHWWPRWVCCQFLLHSQCNQQWQGGARQCYTVIAPLDHAFMAGPELDVLSVTVMGGVWKNTSYKSSIWPLSVMTICLVWNTKAVNSSAVLCSWMKLLTCQRAYWKHKVFGTPTKQVYSVLERLLWFGMHTCYSQFDRFLSGFCSMGGSK